MAAQVTHIALAERAYDLHFAHFDKQAFFIGTSFPDIRYLGVIDRAHTHTKNLTLTEVINAKSAFQAGLLYHSFIDDFRENFMSENGIYKYIPKIHRATQAVKCFEDQFFYEDIEDWKVVMDYFNSILPEENEFGVETNKIQKWHSLLQEYFSEKPTTNSVAKFMSAVKLPDEVEHEILGYMSEMEKNQDLVKIIEKFHESFNELILK